MGNRKSPVRLTLLTTLAVLVGFGTGVVSAIKRGRTRKKLVMNVDHMLLAALGVIATPNAVLGYVHLLRQTDDVEVQATYTRTANSSGEPVSTPVGGASVDVERIEPRVIEITLARLR
jgi:hypothetical protein